MKKMAISCAAALFCLALFAGTAPAQEWELRMVPIVGDDWASIKFHETTGESWRAYNGNWVRCGEAGQVPQGSYDVIIIATDAEYGWYGMRINKSTGQSWKLDGGDWVEMEDQAAEDQGTDQGNQRRSPK